MGRAMASEWVWAWADQLIRRVLVPGGWQPPVGDAPSGIDPVAADGGRCAWHGHVVARVARADAVVVLAPSRVHDPVVGVFDGPVRTPSRSALRTRAAEGSSCPNSFRSRNRCRNRVGRCRPSACDGVAACPSCLRPTRALRRPVSAGRMLCRPRNSAPWRPGCFGLIMVADPHMAALGRDRNASMPFAWAIARMYSPAECCTLPWRWHRAGRP